ncbi:phytanoyl-CoA dioxygenase family protein [Dapis sp. BLCC M229]|uniref:phytanoyl-CoA dioxygenase family protein n=1 Tax=Dapis sp. BLCC M229 TaxID=3400188 RepID=UPI003CE7ECB9
MMLTDKSMDIDSSIEFVNRIDLSPEDRQFFSESGFIKIENFLTKESVLKLRQVVYNSNQLRNVAGEHFPGEFSTVGYEGYDVEELVADSICYSDNFQYVMSQLMNHNIIFTQGIGFELKHNHRGLFWHCDIISFSYIMPEDLGYSLWIPLDPVNTSLQHGGLACVPRKIYSAQEQYALIYQITRQPDFFEFLQTEDFYNMGFASKVEDFIIERNKIEYDFSIGDVLLFDKFVWHRSCLFNQGDLPSRMAYTIRFIDRNARYSKFLRDGVNMKLKETGEKSTPEKSTYNFGDRLSNLEEGAVIGELSWLKK